MLLKVRDGWLADLQKAVPAEVVEPSVDLPIRVAQQQALSPLTLNGPSVPEVVVSKKGVNPPFLARDRVKHPAKLPPRLLGQHLPLAEATKLYVLVEHPEISEERLRAIFHQERCNRLHPPQHQAKFPVRMNDIRQTTKALGQHRPISHDVPPVCYGWKADAAPELFTFAKADQNAEGARSRESPPELLQFS